MVTVGDAKDPSSSPPPASLPRPKLEVADILHLHASHYAKDHPLSLVQRKVIHAIVSCRTAVLGGHLEECDRCGYQLITYNSCRNRHCPKCQGLAQAHWLRQRQDRILDVPHF